jgi:hypothetical protein
MTLNIVKPFLTFRNSNLLPSSDLEYSAVLGLLETAGLKSLDPVFEILFDQSQTKESVQEKGTLCCLKYFTLTETMK